MSTLRFRTAAVARSPRLVALALMLGLGAPACDPECDGDAADGGADSSVGPELENMRLQPYDDALLGFDPGDRTVYADGDGGTDVDTGDAGPPEDPLPDCTDSQELTSALVEGGMVLEEGSCWLVNTRVVLRNGTLDVRRGVRVEFAAGTRLLIDAAVGDTSAALKIAGTAVNPVRFIAQDGSMPWQGVHVRDSASPDNTWAHLIIADAGEGPWSGAAYSSAAVYLSDVTAVTMRHVTFQHSRSHGLMALRDVTLSLVDAIFDGNLVPAYLHPNTVSGLGGELAFIDNENPYVRVTFGNTDTVSVAGTWPALTVPYRIEDRTWIDAALTIAPGAVLEVARGAALHVRETGALTAVGTVADPITFRAVEAGTRGAWKGLTVASTAGATPAGHGAVFDHCTFEDGGGAAWTGGADTPSMLFLNELSSVRITNSTFRNSAKYALWANGNASIAGFANNTITGNARTMLLHPDRVGELAGTSSISGNDDDAIDCTRGNNDGVTTDATWKNLGVPYRSLNRLHAAAALTLEPGVTVQFPVDQGLSIRAAGSLTASGTAAEPVTLTGYTETATGSWLGVRFYSAQAVNSLTHTNLTYTGSSTWTGSLDSDAAIFLEADAGVSLTDVSLGPGSGYGIYLSRGSSVSCTSVAFSTMDGAIYDLSNAQILSACP